MLSSDMTNGGPFWPISSVYAAATYTGTAAALTVTSGVDTANGGMVWIKKRSDTGNHNLFDASRGVSYALRANTTPVEASGYSTKITALSSTGFTLGADTELNALGATYVAWSFRERSRFFDVVTYTGNGAGARTISHSLGIAPGLMIVSYRDTTGGDASRVWHTSYSSGQNLDLQSREGGPFSNGYFSTLPTATQFTVGSELNTSSRTYVAYLFAHDVTQNGIVKCGTYTGNGSASGPSVNVGWRPQFLLIKSSTGTSSNRGEWVVLDATRGLDAVLLSSTTAAETAVDYVDATALGFDLKSTSVNVNANGETYIYMAVRA